MNQVNILLIMQSLNWGKHEWAPLGENGFFCISTYMCVYVCMYGWYVCTVHMLYMHFCSICAWSKYVYAIQSCCTQLVMLKSQERKAELCISHRPRSASFLLHWSVSESEREMRSVFENTNRTRTDTIRSESHVL